MITTPLDYLAKLPFPTHSHCVEKHRAYARRVHNLPTSTLSLHGTLNLLELQARSFGRNAAACTPLYAVYLDCHSGHSAGFRQRYADRRRHMTGLYDAHRPPYLRSIVATEALCSDVAILAIAAWRAEVRSMEIDHCTGEMNRSAAAPITAAARSALRRFITDHLIASVVGPAPHDDYGPDQSCSSCAGILTDLRDLLRQLNPALAKSLPMIVDMAADHFARTIAPFLASSRARSVAGQLWTNAPRAQS